MLRFRLQLVAYSTRLMLPIALGVLAICVMAYLAAIPLNDPHDPSRELCSNPNLLVYCPEVHPSRFGWQVPLAVLIGLLGVGSAVATSFWNRRHPRPRPLPPLPAGWQ